MDITFLMSRISALKHVCPKTQSGYDLKLPKLINTKDFFMHQ